MDTVLKIYLQRLTMGLACFFGVGAIISTLPEGTDPFFACGFASASALQYYIAQKLVGDSVLL